MKRSTLLLSLSAAGLALAASPGCKPDLGAPISVVGVPRILAIRGVPAEAAPGTSVTYDLLAVDDHGPIASPQVTWAQCHIPKSPADPNVVNVACLSVPDDSAPAPTFTAPMPMGSIPGGVDGGLINIDACQHFGPDAPTDMPGVRPRDPDVTGGYYQPVRANLTTSAGTITAFDLERIRCDLANAPADITVMYNQMYKLNENPKIAAITLDPDGAATPLFTNGAPAPATPATVSAGQRVPLRVAWADASAETYLVWNLSTHMLEQHREALSVSWFTTAGQFEHDSSGRDENDTTDDTDDLWTAPATPGTVFVWAVLKDSRGGVDFAQATVTVTP
jgi:hypothetical protein